MHQSIEGAIPPSSRKQGYYAREAALLQTFPKKYRFPLDKGRYQVALLIGNALPPEFIRRHATALKQTVLSIAKLGSAPC